jgi:hypothetical protein
MYFIQTFDQRELKILTIIGLVCGKWREQVYLEFAQKTLVHAHSRCAYAS